MLEIQTGANLWIEELKRLKMEYYLYTKKDDTNILTWWSRAMETVNPIVFFMDNYLSKGTPFVENVLRNSTPLVFFNVKARKLLIKVFLKKAGLSEDYIHFQEISDSFTPEKNHDLYNEISNRFCFKILQIIEIISNSIHYKSDLRFDVPASVKNLLPLLVEQVNNRYLSTEVSRTFYAYLEHLQTRYIVTENQNPKQWKNFGTTEIVGKYKKENNEKMYTIVCSTIQMSILMIFNHNRVISIESICKMYDVTADFVMSAFLTLVKYKILSVRPKNNRFGKL